MVNEPQLQQPQVQQQEQRHGQITHQHDRQPNSRRSRGREKLQVERFDQASKAYWEQCNNKYQLQFLTMKQQRQHPKIDGAHSARSHSHSYLSDRSVSTTKSANTSAYGSVHSSAYGSVHSSAYGSVYGNCSAYDSVYGNCSSYDSVYGNCSSYDSVYSSSQKSQYGTKTSIASFVSHRREKKREKKNQRNRLASQISCAGLKHYLRGRGWSLPQDSDTCHHAPATNANDNDNDNDNSQPVVDPCEGETVRRRALNLLETLVCKWAASIEKNATAWQRTRVTLVTFGSYRLGAYRQDSDVDLLALCPPSITREDFFTSLVEIMEKETAIGDVLPIAAAYTPVLKFTVYNIHFDMLFGRASGNINLEKLIRYQRFSFSPFVGRSDATKPGNGTLVIDNAEGEISEGALKEFFIEDSFLLGVEDESEARSANGVRVTQFIMEYVPNPDHFRVVLCAVKEWALLHGIYSNALGFLGGVNWAIMVAYVCKKFPCQKPPELLFNFFRIFATWKWPKPVMLEDANHQIGAGQEQQHTAEKAKEIEAVTGWKPWDPNTNPRDSRDVMPVITPVFPRMNSTYNVGVPQQRRIQEELIRAAGRTYDQSDWRALYDRSDFFERHVNFLQVSIRVGNNRGDFTRWLRFCESRLRLLVTALECPEMTAFPYSQLMRREYTPETSNSSSSSSSSFPEALFFIGLRFAPTIETIDLKQQITDFLINQINSWEGRKAGMDLMIRHVVRKDLPHDLIKYVVPEPHPFDTPDLIISVASPNNKDGKNKQKKTQNHKEKASTGSAPTHGIPVPKDINGTNDADMNSATQSTTDSSISDGSIAMSDGATSSHSPLGNLITLERCHLLRKQNNSGSTKDNSKHSRHQKTDELSSKSQADQSATRSPIKKRPKNRNGPKAKVSR